MLKARHQFVGTGGYSIESIAGSAVLSTGTIAASIDASHFVQIRDSFQNAGMPVFYRAVPAPAVDVQLAVASSDLNSARRSATTSSADPGVGVPATLVYTPTVSGWHALILLDNSLTAGTVTLYADTTAPTGSISIDGGASTTTSKAVTLDLSAADTQTGVSSMQISIDGVFDTEPVLPYSTSGSATLPGGSGIKTVSVRYMNNAGMWSDAVSGTITLVARVTSVKPSSGPLAGGKKVTIRGQDLDGATAVSFGSTPATSFTVVSPTKITAVAPAHTPGTVHVRVTQGAFTTPTRSEDAYTYVAAPTVTRISPASGPKAGGTTVTITGTHFLGATSVTFGAKHATGFTVVSSTKITAVAPAHATGVAQVRVRSAGGTSVISPASRYRYV